MPTNAQPLVDGRLLNAIARPVGIEGAPQFVARQDLPPFSERQPPHMSPITARWSPSAAPTFTNPPPQSAPGRQRYRRREPAAASAWSTAPRVDRATAPAAIVVTPAARKVRRSMYCSPSVSVWIREPRGASSTRRLRQRALTLWDSARGASGLSGNWARFVLTHRRWPVTASRHGIDSTWPHVRKPLTHLLMRVR